MAIAVAWQTVVTNITSSAALYTTPTGTAATFGGYVRDLVITNSGASILYVTLGTATTSAAAATGFAIPTGGTVLLTQCGVPNLTKIWGFSPGTAAASIGFATNVSYI